MQKESSSSDGFNSNNNNDNRSSTDSSPHLSRYSLISPDSEDDFDPIDFTSFYPSMFTNGSTSPSYSSFDYSSNALDTENRLNQASFILEYQQLYNCYTFCLSSLQESVKELDALRLENENLQQANSDLVQRMSLLSQATIQNCLMSSANPSMPSLINDFNRMSLGSPNRQNRVAEDISSISPTSVMENSRFEKSNIDKVPIPKSISVRSNGYLKLNQQTARDHRATTRSITGQRIRSPGGSQRVYVAGGKKEQEALELDVYNQGMQKTELCNKWQETGICPYGNNCQFAHGISELRPVIRHPRYKTEVCRMVLSGDVCPYGHRCHFRHSLTEQESLLAARQ